MTTDEKIEKISHMDKNNFDLTLTFKLLLFGHCVQEAN